MAADEDGDMTFFNTLFASPAGGEDDNSVDIYDGLDSLPAANTSTQCTPSRDLDLYEELLTEEGTAKESSYKNLHEEYEKGQRQLKELLQKLNDLQTQNSGLLTENQCLKKNISALIKTARVEISRKDDEISRLSQRMLGVPGLRSNYARNPLPTSASTNSPDVSNAKEFKSKSTNESLKTDQRQKDSLSKEVHRTSSPQNTDKDRIFDREKESTLYRSKTSHEKHSTDSVHSRLSLDNCSDDNNKRRRKETRTVDHSKSRSPDQEKESTLRTSKVSNEKLSSDSVRSRLATDNFSDEDRKRGRKETRMVDHSKGRPTDQEKEGTLDICKASYEKLSSDSVRSRLATDDCSDDNNKRGRKETRTVDRSKGRPSDQEKESTLHISKASYEKLSSDSVRSRLSLDNCSDEDSKRERKETRTVDHSKSRSPDQEKESTLPISKAHNEKLSSDSVHLRLTMDNFPDENKRGRKETRMVEPSKGRPPDQEKESTLHTSKASNEKLSNDSVRLRLAMDDCSDDNNNRGRKETRTIDPSKGRLPDQEKESTLHTSKASNEKLSNDSVRLRLATDDCSDDNNNRGRKETRTVDPSKGRPPDQEKESSLYTSKASNEKLSSDSVHLRLTMERFSDENKRGRKETRMVDASKGRPTDQEKESTLHISKASNEKPSSDSVRSRLATDNCSDDNNNRGRKETRTVDPSKGRPPDQEKESPLHVSKASNEKLSSDSVRSRLAMDNCSDEDNKRGRKETRIVDPSTRESVGKHKDDENKGVKKHTNNEPKNVNCKHKVPAHVDKAGQSLQNHEIKNLKPISSSEAEDQTDLRSLTRRRPPTVKEKSPAKEERHREERLTKRNDKSPNIKKKEIPEHRKEVKKSEHKNKPTEKEQEEPRRSSRVNSLHSKSDAKSHDRLRPDLPNDSNSGNRAEYRRERSWLEYSSKDGRSNSSSRRANRHALCKETGSKHEKGDKKSERHISEGKNKRHKKSPEGTRHCPKEKKETKETKRTQEAKQPTDKDENKLDRSSKTEIEENTAHCCPSEIVCKTVEPHENEEHMCQDPKLSFMEKLNLTLSPAKRKSLAEIEELQAVLLKAREEGATRAIEWAQRLALTQSNSTDEKIESMVEPLSINETSLAKEAPEQTCTKTTNYLEEAVVDILQSESAADGTASLPLATEATDFIRTDFQPSSVLKEGASQNTAVDDDLETVSSEDLETRNIVEEAEDTQVDSLVEIDIWNVCASSESLDSSAEGNHISKNICEAGVLKSQQPVEDDVGNTCSFKPSLTESERSLVTLSNENQIDIRTSKNETIPDIEDDSSVMSVDLNYLRNIPQALSPLTSPMRPVVKICRLESPAMASVMRNLSKDLSFDLPVVPLSSKDLSREKNKENQNPVGRPEKCHQLESPLELPEELEEGEIVSEDDTEKLSQERAVTERDRTTATLIKSKRKASPDQHTSVKHEVKQKKRKRKTHSREKSPKMTSPQGSACETRAKATRENSASSKETESDKEMSSPHLEVTVKIAEPSTVREIMQMLRAVRDHIRKKYMKFKVQFSLRQFHGIIEAAKSKFTSLLNSLDWSRVCTSPDYLKQKLCRTIESSLKQVKKNGIVDRIFGQHVLDMKKKLWKFVDDQLHYLFEKVKVVLAKLCDLAKEESECDGGSPVEKANVTRSISPVKEVQKPSKKCQKAKSPKSKKTPSPRSKITDLQSDISQRVISLGKKKETPKIANRKSTFMEKLQKSATNAFHSEGEHGQGSLDTPPNLQYRKEEDFKRQKDACMSDFRSELEMDQQTSSLTFNLVSDVHMGEIFKSLLHDDRNLPEENSSLEKSCLQFGTPDKGAIGGAQCDSGCISAAADTHWGECFLQSETPDGGSSPVAASEKSLSISSILQMPVHPDILDESCMLEVPTFSFSSKDNTSCEEKDKSYISILMEDLAVSLTVPSPLKSDCHLSFLRHEGLSTSTPEEVINAHYSEDALLEGEDATEQDIHLALESDNSSSHSSCSSSWANPTATPGFQYHPNQPMQAVVMEKSNDHFVVKIRRAVLTSLPNTNQTTLTDAESMTSLTWNKNMEIKAAQENVVSVNSAGSQVGETVSEKYLNVRETADELLQERAPIPPELPGRASVQPEPARRAHNPSELATQAPMPLELAGSATTSSELAKVAHTPLELFEQVPTLPEQARLALPTLEQAGSDPAPFEPNKKEFAPPEPAGPVPTLPEPARLTPELPGPDLAKCSLVPPEPLLPGPLPPPEPHGPNLAKSSLALPEPPGPGPLPPPEPPGADLAKSSLAPPEPPGPGPLPPPEPPGPDLAKSSLAPPEPPGPAPLPPPEPPGPDFAKSSLAPPEPPGPAPLPPPEPPGQYLFQTSPAPPELSGTAHAPPEPPGQCPSPSSSAPAEPVPDHHESTGPCLPQSSPAPPDLPVRAPSDPPGQYSAPPEPPEPCSAQSPAPLKTPAPAPAPLDPLAPCPAQSPTSPLESLGLFPAQSPPSRLEPTAPNSPEPAGLVPAQAEPSGLGPPPHELARLAHTSHETSGESSEMDSCCSGNGASENSSELIFVEELEAPEEVVRTFNNDAVFKPIDSDFFNTSPDHTSMTCAEVTFVDLTEETDDEESKNETDNPATSAPDTLSLESGTTSCDRVGSKRKRKTGTNTSCTKKLKHNPELVIETKRQRKKTKKAEESEFFTRKRSSNKKATPENTGAQLGSSSVSPPSLSAKNVIKRKGEVVVSWTRDEDREILLECRKEGPSEEAFVTLALKLKKDIEQVQERFQLLMKLFRKSTNASS